MKQLNPEHWRILDYLYQHKLHTVRPKLAHVRKAQKISNDDVIDLISRGYVVPLLGDHELPEVAGQLPRLVQSTVATSIRLQLPLPGLQVVLDDPGNQIRYTLGQNHGPMTLAKLFHGNTLTIDNINDAHRRGQLRISLDDLGEVEDFSELGMLGYLLAAHYRVELTAKGREYLPL